MQQKSNVSKCAPILERTNNNKKFLKKPDNKTAKKRFFKELLRTGTAATVNASTIHARDLLMIDEKILNDMETFKKILEFADFSNVLDLKVVFNLLFRTRVEMRSFDLVTKFFKFVQHGLLKVFFKYSSNSSRKL
jgi:hypothetical protein